MDAPEGVPLEKRMLRSEVLVVVALSFAASAAYSVLQFVYDIFNTPVSKPVTITPVPHGFNAYVFVSNVIGQLVQLAPVALIAHLLPRSGMKLGDLGFDRSRLKRDVPVGSGLAFVGVAATYGTYLAATHLGLPFRPIVPQTPGGHPAYWVLIVATSAVAAVSEELIVNAYLLTRLKQLGWGDNTALAASTLLRATYHLYQGIGGFIGNVVGGAIVGRIYQRTGRVMPIVVAHFVFDLTATVGYLALHGKIPGLR